MQNDIEQQFIVGASEAGKRLDLFVAAQLGMTRSQVQKMIMAKQVYRNHSLPKKPGDILKEGDRITIVALAEQINRHEEIISLHIPIIAETEQYIIIDKPSGILSHPTPAKEKGTVIDWARTYYPAIDGVGDNADRPGMMHRLDREASGLMVLAKTQKMFMHLKKQFQTRQVEKEYTILVYGTIPVDHDMIDFPIDRKEDGRMAARPHMDLLKVKNVGKEQFGKEAITEFWVLQRYARHTLVRVRIHTGRTHQIRVHMYAYGYPVAGDTLYENKRLIKKKDSKLGRLFLHATRLGFHDLDGTLVSYESSLLPDLTSFIDTL